MKFVHTEFSIEEFSAKGLAAARSYFARRLRIEVRQKRQYECFTFGTHRSIVEGKGLFRWCNDS